MGALVLPRATGFLRSLERAPIDVEKEYVRRRLSGKTASSNASTPTWFSETVIGMRDGATREQRNALDTFLAACGRLAGGEILGSELQTVASVVYGTLGTADDTDTEAETAFGGSRKTTATLKLLQAAGLKGLCADHLMEVEAAATRLRGLASSRVSASVQPTVSEFGADIQFLPSKPAVEKRQGSERAAEPPVTARDTDLGFLSEFAAAADGPPQESSLQIPWFRLHCEMAAANGAMDGDYEMVGMSVASILMSSSDNQQAADALFDLLGFSSLDAISEIVTRRALLVTQLRDRISKLKAALSDGDGNAMPVFASSVSIATEADRLAQRQRRKEERKVERRAAAGSDPLLEWLRTAAVGFGAVLESDSGAWAATEDGDTSFQDLGFAVGGGGGSWAKGVLPAGTTRQRFQGYEDVTVPAPKPAPMPEGEELVPISELASWAQPAFEGYKHLNRIQSRIFQAAYHSNENLLVCAPTGAGKTNIAMLAVLHELAQHVGPRNPKKPDDFKIVYVAPMKALAAEVAAAFSRRLSALGISVRELTGDMQLSKKELAETQMIVTTPEKWDVITRKGGEMSVAMQLRLFILDEVHLLNDERGAVIETLVARTQRQVEASQCMIRLVGLSATLPSPHDVAKFLGVNSSGLFTFDSSFRPIPLTQRFLGVTETNPGRRLTLFLDITYREVAAAVRSGKQAMVFVHSRKDTARTARSLSEEAQRKGEYDVFASVDDSAMDISLLQREAQKSRNAELRELAPAGFGCHHAGMLRSDRTLTEKMFAKGVIKVLVCTATLAWGVNLPAHTVVIKGTQVYDAQRGGFKDLGVLDVQQIFGRAGRPQFDTSGEGIIVTEHKKLPHYLGMLTHSVPIESQFVAALPDNLNAEVVLGTVTNVREGVQWLGYTYLHVRMAKNPLNYALTWADVAADPQLLEHRRKLVSEAARTLDRAQMVRFDERAGQLYQTEAGRVASHFYIRCSSMEMYNDLLKRHMSMPEIFDMVARSSEFENISPREEEMPELEALAQSTAVPIEVRGGLASKEGKTSVLLQVYISRGRLDSFSLIADTAYISQSIVRICRALFELVLRKGWPSLADSLLVLAKCAERRMWPHQSPLRQFEGILANETLFRLEDRRLKFETLQDMSASDVASVTRLNNFMGQKIVDCVARSSPLLLPPPATCSSCRLL